MATIIGHPGCGKSFLALDLAAHIAAGQDWQGRKVKGGLVVYLAAEGQRGQQNRFHAWRMHHRLQGIHLAMIPVAVNLRDREADVPKLAETIRIAIAGAGEQLAVLVVDTLNRTFGGGDENGSDMTDYVDNVGRLKAEFGCTALVVHHIPKSSENGSISERGHGSLRGAIETSLVVSHDQDTGLRTLRCAKQKDAEDGWSSTFRLQQIELGHDEDGDPVTSCVVIQADEEPAAVAAFAGPKLSPVQRETFNELLATIEAAPLATPSDFPAEFHGTVKGGRVASRRTWRDRWQAIGAGDLSSESAQSTFRRAAVDLRNKGLIGSWNDLVWVVNK
jgi:hypothetical protein